MEFVQPIRDKEKIQDMYFFLKRQSYRDYFLFKLGINVGLRVSDLLSLRVCDVKGQTHLRTRETKTSKARRLLLPKQLREEIEEYTRGMRDDEYLFPSRQGGKPISRVRAYQLLTRAAKMAEIGEVGTHTLRKTFGYHYYQQTKDVAMLQQIFNHTSPSITLRYIGINQDLIDKSLENFCL